LPGILIVVRGILIVVHQAFALKRNYCTGRHLVDRRQSMVRGGQHPEHEQDAHSLQDTNCSRGEMKNSNIEQKPYLFA